MKKVMKAIAAIILISTVVWAVGFTVNDGKHNQNDANESANFYGYDYVNLGLPSGTLWATCNVGASKPEDYGSYFAWGETRPKSVYDWNTYRYTAGDTKKLTKYCSDSDYGYNGFADNMTVLQSVDDAATANWGRDWCTPTHEQLWELYCNTTQQWTTRNGVRGRLFLAPNGNSIFLPAAGYRDYDRLYEVGGCGYYWSNTINRGEPTVAKNFDDAYQSIRSCGRCYGLPVRPVRSAK